MEVKTLASFVVVVVVVVVGVVVVVVVLVVDVVGLFVVMREVEAPVGLTMVYLLA